MVIKAVPNGVAHAFWAEVEQRRIDQQWTQAYLCDCSGVYRSAYISLRTGRRKPQSRIVLALAKTVEIEPNEALALAGLAPATTDIVRRTILAAREFTPMQRDAMLAVLEVFEADHPTTAAVEVVDAQQSDAVVALLGAFNRHRRGRRATASTGSPERRPLHGVATA